MINALFAYIGTELIGVTVGEAENPRENVPKVNCCVLLLQSFGQSRSIWLQAIRRTFWRIAIF
jgi:yeast amino acid transporter